MRCRHRIKERPLAVEDLRDVVAEVGNYAWRYANVPFARWAAACEAVGPDDEWFFPGVDLEVLHRLRN